jgi:tyrosine-specific transport protein
MSKCHLSPTAGGALLVAGSCIGAGMLGLPILAGLVGLVPSLIWLVIVWTYMLATALLLAEANLWFPQKSINLLTLSELTLGKTGKLFAWLTFIFLFYSLLVAYTVKAGQFVHMGLIELLHQDLPPIAGPITLMGLCGGFVYFGANWVDNFNRIGMLGLIATYCYLIALAGQHMTTKGFIHHDWDLSLYLIPFLIISFGFHNMLPSIKTYLNHDAKALIQSVKLGSLLPLVMYAIWLAVMVSALPLLGENGIIHGFHHGEIATEPLSRISLNPKVVIFAQGFAFFAIVTSILGQGLSLVDFLDDGLEYKGRSFTRGFLCLLVFLPPLIFSQLDPNIFFKALEYAGGIAAILLFGIMPALIVWRGRYHLGFQGLYQLFGGKTLLIVIALSGLFVLGLEVGTIFKWWQWPIPALTSATGH